MEPTSNSFLPQLRSLLHRIDGRGYKAYKELKGRWELPDFLLQIDHVQGDPFAAPSRVRVFLDGDFTGLPRKVCIPGSRAHGTAALLARRFQVSAVRLARGKGTGKSGEIRMEAPGQEVLPQTAVRVAPDGGIEARFTVGLPARGRRVMGREAVRLLLEVVPQVVDASLRARAYGEGEILRHADAKHVLLIFGWEVEVVSAVFVRTIRGPHLARSPRYTGEVKGDAVISHFPVR